MSGPPLHDGVQQRRIATHQSDPDASKDQRQCLGKCEGLVSTAVTTIIGDMTSGSVLERTMKQAFGEHRLRNSTTLIVPISSN